MTTIGLFGPPDDQEVAALAQRLEHRGAEPWIVDLGRLPADARLRWAGDAAPEWEGRSLLEMDAAYLRRVETNLPTHARYGVKPPDLDPKQWQALLPETLEAYRAARPAQALRNAVLVALARRRPVVNPPAVQNLHRLKTHLLLRLQRAGLPVPTLAAGTDEAGLKAWAGQTEQRHEGVVDKPVAGIYKTRRWSAARHAERPWSRRPALLQRLIRGATVRVYVLAGQVLTAAKIVHAGAHVDSSLGQTGVEVLELDAPTRAAAEGAARTLELEFCGLDLMLDETSDEVFLIDCNLSPMFVNHGRMSHCDIAGHLADHLITLGQAQGDREQRRPAVLDLVDQAKALLADDPELRQLMGARAPAMTSTSAPQVGIFGRKADPQVQALADALRHRGATPRVIDFYNFPRFNLGHFDGQDGAASHDDVNQPDPVRLDALDVVHLRPAVFSDLSPDALPAQDDAAAVSAHYRAQSARLAYQLALVTRLSMRLPVINPPHSFVHHRTKAQQHALLLRHGIPTPEALITNQPRRARRFIEGHDGRVVAKPLASGAEVVLADAAFWRGAGRALPRRPFIFQRYVHGRSYRVYLLGGAVASAGELHYDDALVDWRERTTGAETWEVPDALAEQLRRATRLLDLPCCGVDVEWDESSARHYLLDLNPAALFVGWGQMLGIDAAGQLADYLLRVTTGGDIWEG